MVEDNVNIEVLYAQSRHVHVIALAVTAGSTLEQAIRTSGILERYTEIDLSVNKVGVFSKLRQLTSQVQDGDRLEIYRALIADPKEARRRRAELQKNTNI